MAEFITGEFERQPLDISERVVRLRRGSYREALGQLGREWVSPEVLSGWQELRKRKKVEGKVELPSKTEKALDSLFTLLSATESSVLGRGEFSISKKRREVDLEMSADRIVFFLPSSPSHVQEEIKTAEAKIEDLRAKTSQWRERWRKTVEKAVGGDQEAAQFLIGGIWGMYYGEFYTPPEGWEERHFESPEDAIFSRLLALEGTFCLFDFRLSLEAYLKEHGETPDKFCEALKKTVVQFLKTPGERTLTQRLTASRSKLLDALETISQASLPGQILANKERILASMAGRTGDLRGAVELYFGETKPRNISYDFDTGRLVVQSERGLTGAVDELEIFLRRLGDFSNSPMEVTILPEFEFPEKERYLKPFPEIMELATKLKLLPIVKATLRGQIREGKVFVWFHGVTGTGKTSTAAGLAGLLKEKEPKLAILTLSQRTPKGAIGAVKEAMRRMILGEPSLLIADDVHLALEGASDEQIAELQAALNIFNTLVRKVPTIGGEIFAGEKPPKRHALEMPHRLKGIELTLWREDSDHNLEMLSGLLKTKGEVFKDIDSDTLAEIVEFTAKRITEAGEDERPFLAPSFLLEAIETAGSRLMSREERETVMEDLGKEIIGQIRRGLGERVRDAAEMFSEKVAGLEEKFEALGETTETIRGELGRLRSELEERQATTTEGLSSLGERISVLEGRITELAEARERRARERETPPGFEELFE